MAKTIGRREFLQRLMMGAAAVLVAPTVLGGLVPKDARLAKSIDVQESNWGYGPMEDPPSFRGPLPAGGPAVDAGVQQATESAVVGVDPDDYPTWRRRYAGRTPDNEVSLALSRIELMKRKITPAEFARRHPIMVPLVYGANDVRVPRTFTMQEVRAHLEPLLPPAS